MIERRLGYSQTDEFARDKLGKRQGASSKHVSDLAAGRHNKGDINFR